MYWEKVFDPAGVTLPTINQLHTELMFDRDDPPWNWENAATRYTYVKRCFPLLSHEFLQALSKWSCSHNTVVDLCCGEGWLAHWLSIYSKSHIQAIDDCSWKFTKYLPEVFKSNAVTYVKTHAGVDAYILSWPMLNEALATQIWDALRPGQELLYIGESHGEDAMKSGRTRLTDESLRRENRVSALLKIQNKRRRKKK
jgi:hypothetical protein